LDLPLDFSGHVPTCSWDPVALLCPDVILFSEPRTGATACGPLPVFSRSPFILWIARLMRNFFLYVRCHRPPLTLPFDFFYPPRSQALYIVWRSSFEQTVSDPTTRIDKLGLPYAMDKHIKNFSPPPHVRTPMVRRPASTFSTKSLHDSDPVCDAPFQFRQRGCIFSNV